MPRKPRRSKFRRRARLEGLETRQLLAADGLSLADDFVHADQNSGPTLIDVLGNDFFDSDYAGDRRLTAVSTGSLGGRIEILSDGSSLRYTPPADQSGREVFRYTVDDSAAADVRVDITSPLSPFETTIDLFRDQYEFHLLAGAKFPEGYAGEKRITLVSETAQGSDVRISDDGKSVIYKTETNVSAKDQFTYIVDDLYVGAAVIHINNPLAYDRYEVVQNSGTTNLDVLSNDFLSSDDPSAGGVVSETDWQAIKAGARITHVLDGSDTFEVTIAGDGRSINFTPAEDTYGYRSFRYVVDGRFEQSVSVKVQRPVRDDSVQADVDGGVHTLHVLTNDHYRSIFTNDDVRIVNRVTSVTQGDQGGTVAVSDGGAGVEYTPSDGFVGTETFEYVADLKHRATVTVQVTQTVRDDYFDVYLGTNNRIDVMANDFRADEGQAAEITSVTESNLGATIVIGNNGVLYYTPLEDPQQEPEPYQSDSFEYTVSGEHTATVRLSVRRPTESDSYKVDRPVPMKLFVLSNDHIGSGYLGPRRITSVSDPSGGGTVSISDSGGYLHYQPGNPYETFTYTVDDRYTEWITIWGIPRLRPDDAVADQNGPAITIDVLANDFSHYISGYGPYRGDRVLTSVTESDQGATVSVTEGGRVRYVPPPDFVGQDSFSYKVDEFLTQKVHVHVVRRAADDTVRVAPDSQANSLNVLANDVLGADYLGAGLISDVTPSFAGGQITIADDRASILYTPPAGFTGEDTFGYTIDGQSKATVTVSVHDDASGSLERFESTEQFRDYILQLAVQRYQHQFGKGAYPDYDLAERNLALFDSGATPTSLEYSETNVQVAGVDEHDIVETDGHYIYTLRGNELTIVRSLPADELELVSRIEIEGVPVGMYLNGDRITVISETRDPQPIYYPLSVAVDRARAVDVFTSYPFPELPSTTIVTVLDVADRSLPQIVQRTEFDGRFEDSRRIDDHVFVVLQSGAVLPELEYSCDADDHCTYETEQEYTDRVVANFAALIEQTLPSYESFDGDGQLARGGPLLMPEDIYRSSDDVSSITMVASINMAQSEPGLSATSGVMTESTGQIFASATSLYVFGRHYEAVENEPWTEILKFNWNGDSGAIDFAAMGDVPGRLLNQFSADERDGLLRLTTEISNSGTGNFSNRAETGVFVLEDDAGVLEFIGSLQNLAVGQNIKSVRYLGDRVFVTTFANVDPLYAIDLSDPKAPRALGHVPIPGFNSYMQFVSPDRLLTIGTNTATGFGGRAMVSLFDVSDLNSPRLVDQYNLPKYSTSEAGNDHHAFGWFANHEVLSVPTSRYFGQRYDADQDGYKEATRFIREDELSILHVGIADDGSEGITARGQVTHDAKVERSVSINDFIYSVGLDAIRVVNVSDADNVVEELVFDWDVVSDDHPWVPIDHTAIGTAARDVLVAQKGLDPGSLMLVTQERRDGKVDLVLRSGGDHYRIQGTDETDLSLADEAFAFSRNWHNEAKPLDANGDGSVLASDALMVINELARRGADGSAVDQVLRQVNVAERFVDTNGDGQVTAIDALRIINEIARIHARAAVSGELIALPTPLQTRAVDDVLRADEEDDVRLF